MPRSWIGLLYWLHRFTPHTCSWPLIATGVVPVGGFGELDGDGDGDLDGEAEGDGLVERLGDGELVTVPVQTVPFSVNDAGIGFAVVQLPLKPMAASAPVASAPL